MAFGKRKEHKDREKAPIVNKREQKRIDKVKNMSSSINTAKVSVDELPLLTQEEAGKEILEYGKHVIISLKSDGKYIIEISHDAIAVTASGALNRMNKGAVGTKTYPMKKITGVQYKEPRMTAGYLSIIMSGTKDNMGGMLGAVRDENSIMFGAKENKLILEIKEFIEYKINHQEENVSSTAMISAADEILKFKQLLDAGVITENEFEAKKKQLLEL